PVERREGRSPGPGGGRAGVPTAGGERPGRLRAAATRRAGDRRRPGLSLSQRRSHGGPGRLESLPRIRRTAFPHADGEVTARSVPLPVANALVISPEPGRACRALLRDGLYSNRSAQSG